MATGRLSASAGGGWDYEGHLVRSELADVVTNVPVLSGKTAMREDTRKGDVLDDAFGGVVDDVGKIGDVGTVGDIV